MKLFKLRSIFNRYQDMMFYHTQFVNEINKPLMGVNLLLSFLTFLVVAFGIKLSALGYGIVIILSMVGGIVIGIILVKMGVVSYNAELSNRQNPMLTKISKQLDRLENEN